MRCCSLGRAFSPRPPLLTAQRGRCMPRAGEEENGRRSGARCVHTGMLILRGERCGRAHIHAGVDIWTRHNFNVARPSVSERRVTCATRVVLEADMLSFNALPGCVASEPWQSAHLPGTIEVCAHFLSVREVRGVTVKWCEKELRPYFRLNVEHVLRAPPALSRTITNESVKTPVCLYAKKWAKIGNATTYFCDDPLKGSSY